MHRGIVTLTAVSAVERARAERWNERFVSTVRSSLQQGRNTNTCDHEFFESGAFSQVLVQSNTNVAAIRLLGALSVGRAAERGVRGERGDIIIDSALLCTRNGGARCRRIRVRGIVLRWSFSRSATTRAAERLLGATAAVECRFDLHDGPEGGDRKVLIC